ncbi:hypothetical protein AMATHDRAFT_61084 [Amanita thiersii Skay4041]|uniref:Protein-S-isoprenylcysteine O-methyltransferase n=1 Tax=Amanita thiersii Skay4041 TaxID=703135 RepID=A0A2A9NIR6_9AGAR|nr:hypothetical protein AMATHDRAFT_61084 [Amanita thiersii Skay4041]
MFLFATLAETGIVVARACPSVPISEKILSVALFAGHDGRNIELTAIRVVACLLGLLGSSICLWCYQELGKYFTFELSVQQDHKLIKTGPYSIVRHPSYTSFVWNSMAVITIHGAQGSWVRESGLLNSFVGKILALSALIFLTTTSMGLLRRVGEEDELMKKQFGSQWDEWAVEVPYVLLPGII